jgi:hypothetical protein
LLRTFITTALAALLVAGGAVSLAAQQVVDRSADAPVHMGPLALEPSFQLTNLGIDTNVFNSVDNPQRDFTMTMEPQTLAWLHLGRGLLSARLGAGLVYFRKFAGERAINTDNQVRFDLPLNRFRPYVVEQYSNARQRPTEEIDARARYRDNATTVGVDLGLLSRTTVGVYGRRDQLAYAANQQFFGADLAAALNRTEIAAGVDLKHELTPFTTLVLSGETARDRFELSPDRNSRTVQGTLGVVLSPAALISGNASVGYQSFEMPGAHVSSYHGLTATAGVGYVLLGVTRFDVQVTRQVQYSFDGNTPYYVLSGVSGSVSQELFGPVSLVINGANQQLAYRAAAGVPESFARTDTAQTYGGGLSFRVGPTFDISALADEYQRTSPADLRQFKDLRFGISISYGKQ